MTVIATPENLGDTVDVAYVCIYYMLLWDGLSEYLTDCVLEED